MNFNWLRLNKSNSNSVSKDNSIDQDVKDDPENDIEHQNSNMSFNDEEYVKALTNKQVEDCMEAFAIFVDQEGKKLERQGIGIHRPLDRADIFIDLCSNFVAF